MRAGTKVSSKKQMAIEGLPIGSTGTVMKHPYHCANLGDLHPDMALVSWDAGWTGLSWAHDIAEVAA